MAKRIPFSCVFASGWWTFVSCRVLASFNHLFPPQKTPDEELPQYPASELNSHGPSMLGWRSKLTDASADLTPKEIVLKFNYPAKIYKIQVLAHQYLIRK
jgi:hypothetical protein